MARKLRSDEKEMFAHALKAAELPSPALEEFFARMDDKAPAAPGLDLAAAAWFGEEIPELPPS
jgi:hypothetical protein